MGHRSWLTFVESKKEWLDLWRAITPHVERTNRDLQKSLDDFDYVPAFFSLDYVLSVETDSLAFPRGSAVLAWSSTGDSTIEILPYYLRQQTEYLETFLSKFPHYHRQPKGPAQFGAVLAPVPTFADLLKSANGDEPRGIEQLLPFFGALPETVRVPWGEKCERGFVDQMYRRLYKDPSALSDANQSVFFSYSRKDRTFVRKLANELQTFGIKTWVDEGELGAGDSLIWKISDAIWRCDFFIVVISEHSTQSNWVRKELEIAFTQEVNNDRLKIIPILKDNAEVPVFLRGKVYADFSKPRRRKDAIRKILQSVLPSRVLVELFGDVVGRQNVNVNVRLTNE
jgi:hypothetical protein